MFACIYCTSVSDSAALADFAYGFSPLVEVSDANTVVIDAGGCEVLFGSVYELANEMSRRALTAKDAGGLGCRVNVAVAANPDTAILAAHFFAGITFTSPGEESARIGELPIEALSPINFSILETLRLWGIRTFSDLGKLPPAGVAQRLGQEGARLQRLAQGKSDRQLILVQPAPGFVQSIELEHPLKELEPLSFILGRLLNQLCANLNTHALATNELRLRLQLEDGTKHERTITLPVPMCDSRVFLRLLLLDAETHPPQSAVVSVAIAAEPAKPRASQNGLFIPLAPEPEKLEVTLARLGKLVGAENVGSPELLDTHRPDAFRMRRFSLKFNHRDHRGKQRHKRREEREERREQQVTQESRPSIVRARKAANPQSAIRNPQSANRQCVLGFRVFRPPLNAQVETVCGRPARISSSLSIRGKVLRASGPWRTSGDWWRVDNWARDEWDVAVEGGLCRIYRDLHSDSWFVEGVYD